MIEKTTKAPLLMAHAGGRAHGRENSVAAVARSLQYGADIIELDLRRSRDGILYCYHGFPKFPMHILAAGLRFLTFAQIQKILEVNQLQELLDKINDRAIVFLDLKERGITPEDLRQVCQRYSGQIWVAAFSLNHLKAIKSELGDRCQTIYNFSFRNFQHGLKTAYKAEVAAFKLWPWQCTTDNIRRMNEQGIQHVVHPFGTSRAKYHQLLDEHGSLWVLLDDLSKPEEFLMQI